MMKNYELKEVKGFGNTLVATKSLDFPKLVLSDNPTIVVPRDLITFPQADFKRLQILVRAVVAKHQKDEEQKATEDDITGWKVVEDVTIMLLWYYATLEERIVEQHVTFSLEQWNGSQKYSEEEAKEIAEKLRGFIDTHYAYPDDSWYRELCQTLIRRLQSHLPNLFAKFPEEQLVRLLLIYATNAHEFETEPMVERDGVVMRAPYKWLGLYPLGSKLSHACAPNTVHLWNPMDDEKKPVHFVSLRDIKKDEILTMNYSFGDDHRAVWDRVRRREKLKGTKWFGCNCTRCHEEAIHGDENRKIKCPECGKDGCKVYAFDDGKPANDKVTEEKPWYCQYCHRTFADSEMPLDKELELSVNIEELGNILSDINKYPNRAEVWASLMQDFQMIHKHGVEHLGWQHWITMWTVPFLAIKNNNDSLNNNLPLNKQLKAERECSKLSIRWLRWAETHVGKWYPHIFTRYLVSQSKHIIATSRKAGKLDEERKWEWELAAMLHRFKPWLKGIYTMNDYSELEGVEAGEEDKSAQMEAQRQQMQMARELLQRYEVEELGMPAPVESKE